MQDDIIGKLIEVFSLDPFARLSRKELLASGVPVDDLICLNEIAVKLAETFDGSERSYGIRMGILNALHRAHIFVDPDEDHQPVVTSAVESWSTQPFYNLLAAFELGEKTDQPLSVAVNPAIAMELQLLKKTTS